MSSIAIITARGGSKRIPKKNIKDFCGKPIIAYSIEAALESGVFDEVMVSTDSEEIAQVAREYGANVPFFRSKETSDDFATTADVLKEVINRYGETGVKYDNFACLYPTAPFVNSLRLKDAMERLIESGADSIISVVKFSFPPQRALSLKNGRVQFMYPEYAATRSQDLEEIYHDCGQFYICRTDSFLRTNSMITSNTIPYVLPEIEAQDIDNLSDWEIAKAKYFVLHGDRGKEDV